MYEPIRPVKNMISVARKSHIATLPGVTGGCWTGRPRGRRDVLGRARDRSEVAAACAIVGIHPRVGQSDTVPAGQAGSGFKSKSSRIAGR